MLDTREKINKLRKTLKSYWEDEEKQGEVTIIDELCDMALASLALAPASDLVERLRESLSLSQLQHDMPDKFGEDAAWKTAHAALTEAAAALQAEKE